MDESYTLGENLFLAWQRQAGQRYLPLARRFLLDDTYFAPLAAGRNAYCPTTMLTVTPNALNSAAQAYISTGSRMHLDAARNGFGMIAAQSFATGGWGPEEYFRKPDSDDLYTTLTTTHRGFETPTCGSYAHFEARPLSAAHHARRSLRRQHRTGLPQHGAGREETRGRRPRVLLFGLQLRGFARLLSGSLAVLFRHFDAGSCGLPRTHLLPRPARRVRQPVHTVQQDVLDGGRRHAAGSRAERRLRQ